MCFFLYYVFDSAVHLKVFVFALMEVINIMESFFFLTNKRQLKLMTLQLPFGLTLIHNISRKELKVNRFTLFLRFEFLSHFFSLFGNGIRHSSYEGC